MQHLQFGKEETPATPKIWALPMAATPPPTDSRNGDAGSISNPEFPIPQGNNPRLKVKFGKIVFIEPSLAEILLTHLDTKGTAWQ